MYKPVFQTPPKKLCLVRLSSIGDVTHILPIINTIRTHSPTTEITWIIGKVEHGLVAHIPNIDFVVFDKDQGIRAYFDLHRRLKNRHDAVLLMQLSLRANLIPLCVKAKVCIGFDKRRSQNIHRWVINRTIPARADQHVLDSFFGFTKALGIDDRQFAWDRCYTQADVERVSLWLSDEQKTLIIHPCSSHRMRDWSAARYAEIADYAIQRHKMRVILTGGNSDAERQCGSAIQKAAHERLLDCIGKTNLNELAALIDKADILLSPDSGPAHLATCGQTPVIGLYAASNPERTGPYLSRRWCVNRYPDAVRRILHKDIGNVRWGTRVKHADAMRMISVEDVKGKLDSLALSFPHRPRCHFD